MTDEAGFWSRVNRRGPDECWEWTGSRNPKDYGRVSVGQGQRRQGAHRVSWELAHGPIPDGLWVLHRCDNPPCVNPAHLFLGTNADNAADKAAKGRAITPRGSANPRARFTEAQIVDIRRAHAAGTTQGELARRHGVGQATISDIVHRKSWTHVGATDGE